jgi:hypothetical protein
MSGANTAWYALPLLLEAISKARVDEVVIHSALA